MCDLVGLCSALGKAGRGQIPQDTQAQRCPSTCLASPAVPGPLACPPWYLLSEPGYPGLCPLPRSGPQGPLPTHALRPPLKGHLLGCTGPHTFQSSSSSWEGQGAARTLVATRTTPHVSVVPLPPQTPQRGEACRVRAGQLRPGGPVTSPSGGDHPRLDHSGLALPSGTLGASGGSSSSVPWSAR